MNVPDDRRYTEEHEWVMVGEGGKVRMGISDYAQDALGDVVYVELRRSRVDQVGCRRIRPGGR